MKMNMQRYIDQITEDLDQLLVKVPPFMTHDAPKNFHEEMEAIEDWVMNERGVPVPEFTNITKEQLPPSETLSSDQIRLLNEKIRTLFNQCNFYLDFPVELPDIHMYNAIRENWEKFKLPETFGQLYFDFCEYEKKNCPFPSHCRKCEEWDSEYEKSQDIDAEI